MKRLPFLLLAMAMAALLIVPAKAAAPFTDIGDLDEYTQDNIAYLYEEGVMNGTSDTTFSPDSLYTRAMFVTMLGRMEGVDPSDYPKTAFSDVPAGRWDAPYIAWAADEGIVNGVGNGKFDPTGVITLEQYSAIIDRYLSRFNVTVVYDSTGDWPPHVYDIDEASSYARAAIEEQVKAGLLSFTYEDGDTAGVYVHPKQQLTRAWIAVWFGDFHYIFTHDDSVSGSTDYAEITTWAEWGE